MKESIRRSFRRLRSRKGSRGGAERTPKKEGEAPASPTPEAVASPVSRLVEENRVDESVLSMVRCLYFVDTFVRDGKALIINSAHICLHLIRVTVLWLAVIKVVFPNLDMILLDATKVLKNTG